jgi:glycosyltransferase involved in cell wall biosynthesis
VEQFASEGHQIFFASHALKGETHKNLERFGSITYSLLVKRKSFIQYYYNRIWGLVRFCKDHKIDVVYSHFQEANLISVLAQNFCKATFVINRHHSDCAFVDNNRWEKLGDKIINHFAKIYVATSRKVQFQIVDVEKTDPSKVRLINYGYNFDNLPKPDPFVVSEIRRAYPAKILLVQAARFIPEKRHALLISAVAELVAQDHDIKLLLLGGGPLEETIKNFISERNLDGKIFRLGFRQNIMDYFAAADMVAHFSLSEASNSAVKEAAIADTPSAVCNDVGDFDEYIIHGKNGFKLDKENPVADFLNVIQKILNGEYGLEQMGRQLHIDVVNRFDIKNVVQQYRELNMMISNGINK